MNTEEVSSSNEQRSKLKDSDASSETAPLLGEVASTDSVQLPTRRRFLVGPIVALYFMGYNMSYYIVTEYTRRYLRHQEYSREGLTPGNLSISCDTNRSSLVYKTETRATSLASDWIMYYSLAQGCPAIFANIILGSYTDALGRKFLLAVATLGTSVRLVLSAVIVYMDLGLSYFFIGCVLEGCTGQFATITQVSTAYMCDITSPGKQRTLGVIYIEVMGDLGMTAAGFLAGYLIQEFGFLVAMITTAGMLVTTLATVLVFLPESYPKEVRKSSKANVLHILRNSSRFFTDNDADDNRWKYWILLIAHGLSYIGLMCRMPTETLYQLAEPFCWSPERIGMYGTVRNLLQMTLGLASIKVLQPVLDSVLMASLGPGSYAAAFYIIAFSNTDLLLYVALGVNFLGPLGTTMTRSIISELTPPDKQGAIFAAFGAVEVLCNLLSAVQTSAVYAATVAKMRGLVFLVLGSYEAVSTVLLLALYVGWKMERKKRNARRIINGDV